MKTFDLEKTKAGNPVRTSDGAKARIICFDFQPDKDGEILIAAIVHYKWQGGSSIIHYHLDGTCTLAGCDHLNLFMDNLQGWVNVYNSHGKKIVGNGIYTTEEEAKEHHINCGEGVTYITTTQISWEE